MSTILNKKHFCYIPFEGLTIDPRGKAQLCPVWSKDHHLHDFTESSTKINDIFYSDAMKTIRSKMIKDEYVPECEACYKKERKNIQTHRLRYAIQRDLDKAEDLKTNEPKIKSLDISFSNQCNLGCVMCNSIHSSHWAEQEKTMPKDVFIKTKRIYDNYKFKPFVIQQEFLDSLTPLLSKLRHITIKGGEPLYDKNCLNFLNTVSNVNPDLNIRLVSNITILSKRTLNILNKLNNVYLTASIDGSHETYNWIRGFDFKTVDKNFHILSNHPSIKKLNILAA